LCLYFPQKHVDEKLQRIIDECRTKGTKFTDSEFPPNDVNYQVGGNEKNIWRRISEIFQNQNPVLFCDNGPQGFPLLGMPTS
jgi:hypothetical protein